MTQSEKMMPLCKLSGAKLIFNLAILSSWLRIDIYKTGNSKPNHHACQKKAKTIRLDCTMITKSVNTEHMSISCAIKQTVNLQFFDEHFPSLISDMEMIKKTRLGTKVAKRSQVR